MTDPYESTSSRYIGHGTTPYNYSEWIPEGGLTKREDFAKCAMQGLIGCGMESKEAKLVAQSALRFADALIAELAKAKEAT